MFYVCSDRMQELLSQLNLNLYWPVVSNHPVVDIDEGHFAQEGFLASFDSLLLRINSIQQAVNSIQQAVNGDYYGILMPLKCYVREGYETPMQSNPSGQPHSIAYAVVVSAIVLLSLVYHYLIDRGGGSKAYSAGALDFRDTYISIVLFQGAYVWIKFREVAHVKGVYSREIRDKQGGVITVVHEPRFKPPRENGKAFQWIYLGQYATPREASIVYRIAAFYYKEESGLLELEDGRYFAIPPMGERERRFTGVEKREWVKVQARKVYEDFKQEEKGAAELLQELLAPSEDRVTEGRSEASTPYQQQPLPVNIPEHDFGMGAVMRDDHGFQDADSFGGAPTVPSEGFDAFRASADDGGQGFALPNDHTTGFQERGFVPVAQLTPNTHSGLNFNTSNQLDLLQTLVRNQQELISLQQQLHESRAQVSELRHQQHCLVQQLHKSKIQITQLQNQQHLQQQLQVFNQESSQLPGGNGVEDMTQGHYPGLLILERDM